MANNDHSSTDASRYRPSPDTVYDDVGDRSVLINVRTNLIYELNETGARFWQLLDAVHDLAKIKQLMLQEFDVTEADLNREIGTLLASLSNEGLIVPDEEN